MWERETTVCPFCRHTVVKGNFCTYCSKKLVKQCDCWVKKQKYNCGFSQCPGLKLKLFQSAVEITDEKSNEGSISVKELVDPAINMLEKAVVELKEENKKIFPNFNPKIKKIKGILRFIKYSKY